MNYENEYTLKGSEELSARFNDLADCFSDFYKEVWGFRPRYMPMIAAYYESEAALQAAYNQLERDMEELSVDAVRVFDQRDQEEKQAIDSFEAYVSQCIQVGAGNRANAIAWICESYGVENSEGQAGWEDLEWKVGIPFGYINKSLSA